MAFPLALAVLGAGALSAGASAYSASLSTKALNNNNLMNYIIQKEQRDWEEKLANSSYQRAVTDLKAANLNPMLAYQQGGAVTPNVQAAHFESPASIYAEAGKNIGSAVSSLIPQANIMADTALKKTQTAVNTAQTAKMYEEGKSVYLDNLKKEAQNRNLIWEEQERYKRPEWIKRIGLGFKDVGSSAKDAAGMIGSGAVGFGLGRFGGGFRMPYK